ncbi:hypothetical protein STEG23_037188 [Scotinomys teguina]
MPQNSDAEALAHLLKMELLLNNGPLSPNQCPYKKGKDTIEVARQMKGQERTQGKMVTCVPRRGLFKEREVECEQTTSSDTKAKNTQTASEIYISFTCFAKTHLSCSQRIWQTLYDFCSSEKFSKNIWD